MDTNEKSSDQPAASSRPLLGRGRPALRENRQVFEDIVRAVEHCLQDRMPQDISTKDIAARAGTRPAMIYYYFGSKEGLLAEIIRRKLDEVLACIQALRESIDRNELQNPTHAIIARLASLYHQQPPLCRIMMSELLHEDSPLIKLYLRQWRSTARSMMVDALTKLSEAGYYRKDIDADGVAKMIRSVVFFPLIARPYLSLAGEAIEHAQDQHWVDFVSSVFDSYLRPAERNAAGRGIPARPA